MGIINYIKRKIAYFFDKSGNRQIMQITYFFMFLFLAIIIYLSVFMYKDASVVINNPYNKREELYANKVVRGSIYDRNGEVLAYTDTSTGTEKRIYSYSNVFAHVVGYNSYGKAGIESIATFKLLTSGIPFYEKISDEFSARKSPGNSVISTLDLDVQTAAYNALGEQRGAVVVMDALTGEILAMVSKPDFDPNNIDSTWEYMTSTQGDSRLLNRSTQGTYPPGSTFKILTALEYIRENSDVDNYDFQCNGSYEYQGTKINCYHGISHGDMSFLKSFAKSCNSSFAHITTTLDKSSFQDTCEDLLFNSEIPCQLGAKKSYVPITKDSSVDELMQTGIGQGKTEITPYHMCLISSAIANDGVLMNPYLIRGTVNYYGKVVETTKVHSYKRLISSEDSVKLKELMREVVTDGTATKLKDSSGYTAYGKTGSAEFSSNKTESHAWFTGFAQGDDGSMISISVIIENGGSGGQTAVPVAKSVFDTYYK